MEELDSLITISLAPQRIKDLNTAVIQELSYQIDELVGKLKSTLKSEPFSGKNAQLLELEMQAYQAGLIRLLDTVTHYNEQIQIADKANNLDITSRIYEFATKALEDLLSFIEQHLSRYFSMEEKVPDIYILHSRETFKAHLLEIETFLKTFVLDTALIDIATEPIRSFINQREYSYTYRELMYLKELVSALIHLKKMHKEGCAYSALSERLFYLNFNSVDFVNHFTTRIDSSAKQLPSIELKIEHLSWHLKEVSQMHVKPGVSLTSLPSLKEKVIEWLIEEIKHCNRVLSPGTISDWEKTDSGSNSAWHWTGSKTDLIEMLYALYYKRCFNNGDVTLKQIAALFETQFNVQLGDFYRVWQHIIVRKNATQFLDELKELIEKKRDEAVENPS